MYMVMFVERYVHAQRQCTEAIRGSLMGRGRVNRLRLSKISAPTRGGIALAVLSTRSVGH